MKRYDFYSDPGHGWLKVSKKELEYLGIADKITPYSYMRGAYAYLEEDCDVTTFVEILKKTGDTRTFQEMIKEHSANKSSKIRNYEPYTGVNCRCDRLVTTKGDEYGDYARCGDCGQVYRVTNDDLIPMETT